VMTVKQAMNLIEFQLDFAADTDPNLNTAIEVIVAALDEQDQLREACEFVRASLAPYRGEDACPNRAYTVSCEAVKAMRNALDERERGGSTQ